MDDQDAQIEREVEDRDELGRFAPGHRQLAPPRTGKPNKITKALRERVLDGFSDPNDPNGDGITTFVSELKKDFPPAAAGLLARIIPPSGDDGRPVVPYEPFDLIIKPIATANFIARNVSVTDAKGNVLIAPGEKFVVDEDTAKRLNPTDELEQLPIAQDDGAPTKNRAAPCFDQRPILPESLPNGGAQVASAGDSLPRSRIAPAKVSTLSRNDPKLEPAPDHAFTRRRDGINMNDMLRSIPRPRSPKPPGSEWD